jgi:protein-tyrosine phosphatase
MDSRNVTNTMRIFGCDPDNKVRKLLKNKDVSDPWYTDRFDVAYNDIYEGCLQLLENI